MATMLDIAVRAGVSRSTVSFVLNDKHSQMRVNEETRRHVLEVAREMGYRRNGLAHAIATGKTSIFGFLIQDYMFSSEVASRILDGVMDEAANCRHTVQVIRLSGHNDKDVVQQCVELRPAGVLAIYVNELLLEHIHQEMSRFSIPITVLDSTRAREGSSRILSDDIEGCAQAITHLASLGHTRIGFVGGNRHSVASHLREDGYRRAMALQGLEVLPGYVEYGHWDIEITERAVDRLFRGRIVPPTALFCADDKMSMVACRTLREIGLRVPDDVSIVGYAGLVMSEYSDPPLTTIAQPFREMGRTAVRRLLAAADAEGGAQTAEPCFDDWLPTRLIIRRSTGPVREWFP